MNPERKHNHVEAFCRMKYASKDGSAVEWLWNSRDGVTPFIIHSRDGVEMSHVEWGRDQYMPAYVPSVGERIFVDLTADVARAAAVARVEKSWDAPVKNFRPMSERYESKEAAIEMFVSEWTDPVGQPHVVEVTPELHRQLAAAAITRNGRPIVIFDLDGTLALIDHRRPLVEGNGKKDWRAFFAACVDDEPNIPVIHMARLCRSSNYNVIIFSGRSDEVRPETEDWLNRWGINYTLLLMRAAGDFTPDEQLKREWLKLFDKSQILCVYDDRDKVVQMWRDEGLTCFQVATGAF